MVEFIQLYDLSGIGNIPTPKSDFQKIFTKNGFHYYFSPFRGRLYKLSMSEETEFRARGEIRGGTERTPEFLKRRIRRREEFPIMKKLHIFPTTLCNSSCIYCYAVPGKDEYKLDLEIAKKAVDFMECENEALELYFHGGGEPLTERKLVAEIIGYAKKKCKKVRVLVQSNGVMDEKTREWVLRNVDHLAISCDGPPEIQDTQRPLQNGRKSSRQVEETIRFFASSGIGLHVMSTITPLSLSRMNEIVEYFHGLGVRSMGMNPVSVSGKYRVNLNSFGKNFLKARELADRLGIRLFSPQMFPINRGKSQGCGFSTIMFCLTPDGFVSNCYETVSSKTGPQEFLYGWFNGEKFEFDSEKISWMKKRRVENLPYCHECILRWTCAGGCPLHSLKETGDLFKQPKEKCRAKQKMFKEYLTYLAKHGFTTQENKKRGVDSP